MRILMALPAGRVVTMRVSNVKRGKGVYHCRTNVLPGTRLGHYEVVGAIGAGGMGEVYRATDSLLGRDVAIKILPPAFAQDPERLARFEREARVLASLNHPGIAGVYGFEKTGETYFLAMELVPGRGLDELIPLPVEDAMPYAVQICEALEAAHEKGMVHRDSSRRTSRSLPKAG